MKSETSKIHEKDKQDLITIEKELNERMREPEFQKEFFKNPSLVLSREGISISHDMWKDIQKSINNFIGMEKEVPGSILAKESGDNLDVLIHKKKNISPSSVNFVWKAR